MRWWWMADETLCFVRTLEGVDVDVDFAGGDASFSCFSGELTQEVRALRTRWKTGMVDNDEGSEELVVQSRASPSL